MKIIVDVNKLYDYYLELYLKELNNLKIGYDFDKNNICKMRNIISSIFYLENGNLTRAESLNIIENII